MTLPNKVRNNINIQLQELGKRYYEKIPLQDIFSVLEKENIIPVAEDGTYWSGLLCGRNDVAYINLKKLGEKVNSFLVLMWYKMDSGKYEIVSYIS